PEAEFPGIVAMETLHFDRYEQAAVAIIGVAAYARGFEFVLARRVRPGTPGLDKTLRRRCAGADSGSLRNSRSACSSPMAARPSAGDPMVTLNPQGRSCNRAV